MPSLCWNKGVFVLFVVFFVHFSQSQFLEHKRVVGRHRRQLDTIIDIIGAINGGVNDKNIRHPASGGKCLDIRGASPLVWQQVILWDCQRTLGLAPVNQRFSLIEGRDKTVLIIAAFSHIRRCFSIPEKDGDSQVYTDDCDKNNPHHQFRVEDVGNSKIMFRHVPSNKCLKPDGEWLKIFPCDRNDSWMHWQLCTASDNGCARS